MKVFLLLLFVGLASASFHQMLDDAADEFVLSFLEGMQHAPSLREHLGEPDNLYADQVEDEIKTEIGKKLKEVINNLLDELKDAVETGKEIRADFFEKLKALKQRIKEVKEVLGEQSKEFLHKVKELVREYIKEYLHKLGLSKRSADDHFEEVLSELNVKELLKQIKDHLKKTVDPELLKEKIEKIFGQGSELLRHFLNVLKEKGKRKLMILIDRILDEDEDADRESRSMKDYWEKVKEYFKDLKIDLQEKYMKFGEWVKNALDKGMEHSKDKMENIKAIAKEFAKHAKNISKEVASEAGEFFKQYKKELGNLWEQLKEKIDEIRNRQD